MVGLPTLLAPHECFQTPHESLFADFVPEVVVGGECSERVVADLWKHGTGFTRTVRTGSVHCLSTTSRQLA